MISFRSRYRPVTVFGSPLLTVTVFGPTLHNVTDRYHTVTIPSLTVIRRYFSELRKITQFCKKIWIQH